GGGQVDDDHALEPVSGLEVLDVPGEKLQFLALVACRHDVVSRGRLEEFRGHHPRPGLDGPEFRFDLAEQVLGDNALADGRLEEVVATEVPAAEHQAVERGTGEVLADFSLGDHSHSGSKAALHQRNARDDRAGHGSTCAYDANTQPTHENPCDDVTGLAYFASTSRFSSSTTRGNFCCALLRPISSMKRFEPPGETANRAGARMATSCVRCSRYTRFCAHRLSSKALA